MVGDTMPADADQRLELYRLFLATAEKVSDRRMQANAWMLSVNSAIVGLYGYLGQGKASVEGAEMMIWRWAIPAAGILICLGWAALLGSYSKLNGAKFQVLHEIEAELPYPPFLREQHFYRQSGRRRLSGVESAVPWSFVALYAILIIASVAQGLAHAVVAQNVLIPQP